jgi:hypothetical protein
MVLDLGRDTEGIRNIQTHPGQTGKGKGLSTHLFPILVSNFMEGNNQPHGLI